MNLRFPGCDDGLKEEELWGGARALKRGTAAAPAAGRLVLLPPPVRPPPSPPREMSAAARLVGADASPDHLTKAHASFFNPHEPQTPRRLTSI